MKEADWKCAHVRAPISRPRHVLYVLASVFGDFMRFFSETDVLVISSLCGIRDSRFGGGGGFWIRAFAVTGFLPDLSVTRLSIGELWVSVVQVIA